MTRFSVFFSRTESNFRISSDVRKYDAILSIPDLIRTIEEIDPVLTPPAAGGCLEENEKGGVQPGNCGELL